MPQQHSTALDIIPSAMQVFLAGHMPAVAFYTLAAVEAIGMAVSLAKVTGLLSKSQAGGNIWQAYLDTLGVLAVGVLVQVRQGPG